MVRGPLVQPAFQELQEAVVDREARVLRDQQVPLVLPGPRVPLEQVDYRVLLEPKGRLDRLEQRALLEVRAALEVLGCLVRKAAQEPRVARVCLV